MEQNNKIILILLILGIVYYYITNNNKKLDQKEEKEENEEKENINQKDNPEDTSSENTNSQSKIVMTYDNQGLKNGEPFKCKDDSINVFRYIENSEKGGPNSYEHYENPDIYMSWHSDWNDITKKNIDCSKLKKLDTKVEKGPGENKKSIRCKNEPDNYVYNFNNKEQAYSYYLNNKISSFWDQDWDDSVTVNCSYLTKGSNKDFTNMELNTGDKISIKSIFTGGFLSRCDGCITNASSPDNISVHETNNKNPHSQWTLEKLSNGKYTLKGDNGRYLARCSGCVPNSTVEQFSFVHEIDSQKPLAQWDIENNNGIFSFKSDNNKYLSVCDGCVNNGSTLQYFVTIHRDNNNDLSSQWEINKLN